MGRGGVGRRGRGREELRSRQTAAVATTTTTVTPPPKQNNNNNNKKKGGGRSNQINTFSFYRFTSAVTETFEACLC